MFTISKSIKNHRKNVISLKNDKLPTSIGDVWSIKKLLLLDYYLPAFKIICNPNNNFFKWYYADPFCGSGVFSFKDNDLKNEIFPGSGLIGPINAANLGYTGCILSEKNSSLVSALNNRLKKLRPLLNNQSYSAKDMDFEKAVFEILKVKKFGVGILVLIDPAGYVPIKWDLMEKLLKPVGIDIILNFYTHRIAQNASASKTGSEYEKNLDEFFGDTEWRKLRTGLNRYNLGNNLLKHYLEKIQKFCGKNTIPIGVFKDGDKKLYDLIVITRSSGGTSVIKQAKNIMDNATTEAIKSEFKVQSKVQHSLTDFDFENLNF